MKRLMLLLVFILILGCGEDRNSGYYNPTNPYVGQTPNRTVQNIQNKITYNINGGGFQGLDQYPLNFNYYGLDIAVTSAHTSIGGDLQVQLYDHNNNLILKNDFNVSGDLVQHFTVRLNTVPAYVIFDVPGYTGQLQLVLTSYAK